MKRSVTIAGHRTSVWIEDAFWAALSDIADKENISLSDKIADIDRSRTDGTNLSSAIRLAVLRHYQSKDALTPNSEAGTVRSSKAKPT